MNASTTGGTTRPTADATHDQAQQPSRSAARMTSTTMLWVAGALMAVSFGAGYLAGHNTSTSVPAGTGDTGTPGTGSSAPGVSAPPLTQDQLNGASLPPGHPQVDPSATGAASPGSSPAASGATTPTATPTAAP